MNSNKENEVCLIIGEGDRIDHIFIEENADSGWVMRWDLTKLDGTKVYQNFWGDKSLTKLKPEYIEGQFIRSVSFVNGDIKVVFSNGTNIQAPLFLS